MLGRKELPKWYTYINYLKDSNLITVTDDNAYVLKKDLNRMTLWDFYRTLPYPLPIKDELDEIKYEHQEPWLSLLVGRFIDTEGYAKKQLDLPLAQIFNHNQPRKKSDPETEQPKHSLRRKKQQQQPHFEPEAYDKDSHVEQDNFDKEAVIPQGDANNVITEADNPARNNR